MPGALKGPYTRESSCRYDQGQKIGSVGAKYEFDIKMPKLHVDMDNDDFDMEAQDAIADLSYKLKQRYKWIGDIYQSGRSGGWLEITDKKGLATQGKLRNIIDLVTDAKTAFIKRLEREYPAR